MARSSGTPEHPYRSPDEEPDHPQQQALPDTASERTVYHQNTNHTSETKKRPTATPSLQTQSSVDSALGDEEQDAAPNHMDTTDAQQIIDGLGIPMAADGAQAFNFTEDQEQNLQEAVNSGQLAEEQVLAIDDSDSDSALGSDTSSFTTSLTEGIWNYRQEHGRTYHAYKDGKYIFPNDERESDRLDLQHHLFRLTFGNQLHFAKVETGRVLDVGTGTGIWAIEFADQFPDTQVLGIDLSPGQPTMVPPNCRFVVDDVEGEWVYQEKFDYIHSRLMAGSIADWPAFFRQAYENLEPGGWLELQDYGLPVKSSDGSANGTDLMKWGELLCEAARNMGRPMGSDCADKYCAWMEEAGFVDISLKMFMWPSNMWPKNPMMKVLGQWNQTNILEGLEGFCLALLTRGLGWKKEEVDVFVAKVSRDLRDRKIHAYFPMPVVLGRKPLPGEVAFNS